jgi:hypothetical protein
MEHSYHGWLEGFIAYQRGGSSKCHCAHESDDQSNVTHLEEIDTERVKLMLFQNIVASTDWQAWVDLRKWEESGEEELGEIYTLGLTENNEMPPRWVYQSFYPPGTPNTRCPKYPTTP